MEGITEHAPWHELKNWKAQAAACICHWLSFTIIFLLLKKRSYKARFKARQKGNTNLRGPTADQLRRVYRVTCNSFCLFANKWTLAAISVQILYFPRVVYASNKWSSTRPLFDRSRSCCRTLDHFIAHVCCPLWHVSLILVFWGFFCSARCSCIRWIESVIGSHGPFGLFQP